ncbi:hypothetical protein EVAR_17790_1 [Eumeta japonica]|uniref:Uncharacterized protein n=1 Tax=Eumeta variegata TaxID=151549 RepID=A0A4C1TTF9_EUMVA|nr:hypothetical protein EVAR_17790_1 [Eumeta japonica]
MDYCMPIQFVEGNLGQRHKHMNESARDVLQRNVAFNDIRNTQETSIIDRLFKIDLASKCKNVDYIVENLKDRNMLYVSRALKSTWLVTDAEYTDIINPQYLEEELFPKMLTTGVTKMWHFIYMNLKDEARCFHFYRYYKSKQNISIAKHFLPKCSEEAIMSEFDLYIEEVTPHYLKLLCEKCPRLLLKYFDILVNGKKKFKKFTTENIKEYLDVTRILLKLQPEVYFEIIEKYCSSKGYNKRLSSKATKYIMQKHKDKYFAKPELYGGALLHLPTLARYLSEEEARDLVMRLARARYLVPWFTLTYKSAEPLLNRISKEDKQEIIKKIFRDKNIDLVVAEAPYPLPQIPFQNLEHTFVSESGDTELSDNYVEYCMDVPRYCPMALKCRKLPTLLDELFDKYRFTAFSKTFFELKKLLQSESSHKNRLMILNVLVSKTLKHPDHVQTLLELVSTRHANEPSTLRASFLRSLVRRAAAYRLPEEPWQIFHKMVLQVVFQSEEQVPCDEGIHAILLHDILSDRDVDLDIFNKFITVFNPLVEYDLSVTEKQKVYKTLYTMLIAKSKSSLQEHNWDDVIDFVNKILKLFQAYRINIDLCPEVIDIIKEVSENDIQKSKDILVRLYQMGKCRKIFIKENFCLMQTNASYINALRHDVLLLTDTNKFADLVMKGELKMDKFLIKIKVYFPDLAQRFKLIIEDKVKAKPDDAASLKSCRALCILQGPAVLSVMTDLYAGGKENKQLAQRLAANVHMAWSVDHLQVIVNKDVGVIASRNALGPLPAAAVRAQLPALLGGPAPFVRLGVALAFDRLLPVDVLNVIVHVRQSSKTKMKRFLLNKFYKYMHLQGESLQSVLWEQMKALMIEFSPHYNARLWNVLSDSKGVPKVIKMEYCVTILSIQLSKQFKKIDDKDNFLQLKNLRNNLKYLNKNVSELNETDVLWILKQFLESEFGKEMIAERGSTFIHDAYIRILCRFLLSCETETSQNERFATVGIAFMNIIKNSWNDINDDNRCCMRKYFENFIMNLKYNKAFLNDTFANCLPMFIKVVEEMHTFLDVKRHFKLYSFIHLTMVYYKTLQHLKKQQPTLFSEQTNGAEVASAVGLVFGRYLAREHRQLLTDYFHTITDIYVDDVVEYTYNLSNREYLEKLKIAIIQGVAHSGEDDSLYFTILLLHKMSLLYDSDRLELQDVFKLLADSKIKKAAMGSLNYFNEQRTESAVLLFALLPELTEFTLSRPARRAGRGSGGGRLSRVGSFELFLFVPRSCSRGNARGALRIYVERYPDRRHPSDSSIITSAYQRVLENRPIVSNQEGAGRPVRSKTRERVLDLVRQNPRLSTRTAARLLRRNHGARVSHWSVHKTLRRDRQRPYVIHKEATSSRISYDQSDFKLGRRPAALGLRGSRLATRACVSICRDALLCAVRRSGKNLSPRRRAADNSLCCAPA